MERETSILIENAPTHRAVPTLVLLSHSQSSHKRRYLLQENVCLTLNSMYFSNIGGLSIRAFLFLICAGGRFCLGGIGCIYVSQRTRFREMLLFRKDENRVTQLGNTLWCSAATVPYFYGCQGQQFFPGIQVIRNS